MRNAPHKELAPAPRWLLATMLSISALLHVGLGLVASVVLRAPKLDIEFQLPIEVELGTTDAIAAAHLPTAAPQPSRAAPAGSQPSGATPDAGAVDAGPEDAGRARQADDGSVRKARDAQTEATARAATEAGDGGLARVPPGTQIALRVDMARIRRSPIADDVRALLAAIPDWQALLAGSGIDPVDQLERLLIATPNLQREKLVLAGRYVGGEQVVMEAVARLAEARGETATWREEGTVQVAPWHNADRTPRVIALVGPAHFTISRAEDLPRVLAIATARAKRRKREAPHPAEALLSMEEREGLSLEIEGAQRFVQGRRRAIPERLRVSVTELPGQRIEVQGRFTYDDPAAASDAQAYVTELRDTYARNALVALLGLSDPLEDASITPREHELHIRLVLSAEQTRLILGYVRELLTPPARARPAPPSAP